MSTRSKRQSAVQKSLGAELIEAMTEALAYARGEIELETREISIPKLDIAAIRLKQGLSQEAFAERYGFTVSSVRHWEQARRRPGRSALLLLRIIDKNPDVVEAALHPALC